MHARPLARLALPLLLLPATARSAEPSPTHPAPAAGALSFTVENDFFGTTDRYYTSGLRLGWTAPAGQAPPPVAWLDRRLDWLLGPGELRWGLSLSQDIYTPADIRARVADPGDRPYAGLLYGALSLERATERRRTTVELQAGLVGPRAGGEFVQNRWHDVINKYHAEGWDDQIRDEPVLGVLAERRWRLPMSGGGAGALGTEVIPGATLTLGNARTSASAGVVLRLGDGLGADWGPERLRPSPEGSAPGPASPEFGWYVFAGFEGRVVAHDITLDGNTFQDGPRVDRKPLVGDLQAGAAVSWHGMRLAYTQVVRTKEFDGQRSAHLFGSVSLSVPF